MLNLLVLPRLEEVGRELRQFAGEHSKGSWGKCGGKDCWSPWVVWESEELRLEMCIYSREINAKKPHFDPKMWWSQAEHHVQCTRNRANLQSLFCVF